MPGFGKEGWEPCLEGLRRIKCEETPLIPRLRILVSLNKPIMEWNGFPRIFVV